ncbi:MAG TPA: hypothetical protein VIC85_11840 [Ktedonobacterales bacterium]|jgi:hypothetical protein
MDYVDHLDRTDSPGIRRAIEEVPAPALAATNSLMASFARPWSRRWLLRGAVAGATGAALTSAGALGALAVHAEALEGGDTLKTFFSIIATGEELFVTLYRLGVANAERLGFNFAQKDALAAIAVEEQIHRDFAVANGGTPVTNNFSFPHGAETFTNREFFLATQQLAEELTNGALLAFIKDTASMGLPRIAQIGGQLMQVEGGHRVVGRVILGANPWDNWAFGPVALEHFTDVPAAVTAAGFLSPREGNNFPFVPVSLEFPGVINRHP